MTELIAKNRRLRRDVICLGRLTFVLSVLVLFASCTQFETPKTEPFFAQTAPPPKQEFRWSNGKSPRSFDPARAGAPPETDIVRSIFDGLTDIDPKTLKEVPAIAEKWSHSEDFKTWTFHLRSDAKWSNGEPITAEDFVRSWERLALMGDQVSHKNLLDNIAGFPRPKPESKGLPNEQPNLLISPPLADDPLSANSRPQVSADFSENSNTSRQPEPPAKSGRKSSVGFSAEGERIFKVMLSVADPDFPKLVANPIFRPIHGSGRDFESGKLSGNIVTSGPFRISGIGPEGITLDRAENYWNREAVKLERVRFVPKENAEKALAAYRSGEVDAVTNAHFEPLAVKLLEPYEDFRRTTHNALNFYEINTAKPPFHDRRVREALAISIERERLTEGELEGITQPALAFLPFGKEPNTKLLQDKQKARDLLDEAGFPDGKDFPVIKLVINRNDTQHRIARVVARMWKQNLNLETEIVVKEASELDDLRVAGDFDVIRRGVVLPTADERVSLMAIFESPAVSETDFDKVDSDDPVQSGGGNEANENDSGQEAGAKDRAIDDEEAHFLYSEEQALLEVRAIPLYFPTSYSLVKPYVSGFEMNSLDAPLLKDVVIDNNWQRK